MDNEEKLLMLQKLLSEGYVYKAGFEKLTPMEREVIALVHEGKGVAEIAENFTVSIDTIKTHLLHIKDKTGITKTTYPWWLLGRMEGICDGD